MVIFITVLLVILPLAGIIITELSAATFPALFWEKTPCTILQSNVTTNNLRPEWNLLYAYEFAGTRHTNELYRVGHAGFTTFSDVYKVSTKYAEGAAAFCFVNQSLPYQATLKKPSLLNGLSGLLLFFLFVGIGAVVHNLKPAQNLPFLYELLLGAVFFCIPLAFVIGIGWPALKAQQASSWSSHRCQVIGTYSESISSRSVRYYVTYLYEADGRTWFSNEYQFGGLSRNPSSAKITSCYVNPKTPYEAVISRESRTPLWLTIFPLFILCFFTKRWWETMRDRFR